jgi:hypothetical protein
VLDGVLDLPGSPPDAENPKKGPRSSKAIDRSKPPTDVWAIGSPSPPAPALFTGYVFAEFFFEVFPFLVQEIAKDDPGTLLDETSDDARSYPSGAACNDRHLIFESEAGWRG